MLYHYVLVKLVLGRVGEEMSYHRALVKLVLGRTGEDMLYHCALCWGWEESSNLYIVLLASDTSHRNKDDSSISVASK